MKEFRQGGPVVETSILVALVIAVGYLIYRVDRLERRLESGGKLRRTSRAPGDGKVIPILKDNIEPGPFKQGKQRRDPAPDSDE